MQLTGRAREKYDTCMKPCYTCTCMYETLLYMYMYECTVMSPGDLVLSKFGENITHLILFRLICLLTSLRPQTYLRLVLSLRGSFLYTRSWNRTRSVRSNSTTLSISGVTKCEQYLY